MKIKVMRTVGLVLFFLGALIGLLFFFGMSWADVEATFYFGYGVEGTEDLKLSCPQVMTASETNTVTAHVPNDTDRLAEPIFRTDISHTSMLLRTERSQVQVPAGETVQVSWQVTPRDIVFKHSILVKVYQYQAFILPSADAFCGILVLDIPGLVGKQVYILVVVLAFVLVTIGGVLWFLGTPHPLKGNLLLQARGMVFLVGLIALGILVSSLGLWLLGLLVTAVVVLLVGIIIGRFIQE